MTENMARKEKEEKSAETDTLRIERSDALDVESDIYSMLQFNQEHGWHTLVVANPLPDRPSKGLVIIQPGRPTGILKVLVDLEPDKSE